MKIVNKNAKLTKRGNLIILVCFSKLCIGFGFLIFGIVFSLIWKQQNSLAYSLFFSLYLVVAPLRFLLWRNIITKRRITALYIFFIFKVFLNILILVFNIGPPVLYVTNLSTSETRLYRVPDLYKVNLEEHDVSIHVYATIFIVLYSLKLIALLMIIALFSEVLHCSSKENSNYHAFVNTGFDDQQTAQRIEQCETNRDKDNYTDNATVVKAAI